ncbi:MAG: hypothetical protein U0992_24345 [Planctomycetaceae bacterium]
MKFKNAEVGVLRANRDIEVRDSAPADKQAATQKKYEVEEAEARKMAAELDAIKAEPRGGQERTRGTQGGRD